MTYTAVLFRMIGVVLEDSTHPVWTVYDKLRTARLNVKYYSRRLESLESQNFWIELILMATAPSSAVAGFWFWESEYGKIIWSCMGFIAAALAILKPILSLTKRIKEFESVLSGYRTLEFDLREIKTNIEQKKKYDLPLQAEFKKALQREKTLVVKTPETREKKKVKQLCDEEVRQELPKTSFYVPTE